MQKNTERVAQECLCSTHFVLSCGAGSPKQIEKKIENLQGAGWLSLAGLLNKEENNDTYYEIMCLSIFLLFAATKPLSVSGFIRDKKNS